MKKLSLALAALALSGAANAAPITANFNVTVNFTSVCKAKSGNPTTLAFGDYTGFATPSTLASGTFVFECSRGAGAAAFISLDGTAGTTGPQTVSGLFALRGLNYSLTATPAVTQTGVAATAAAGDIGTADNLSVAITGSIGEQAGGGTTVGSGSDTAARTLTITF